MTEIDDILQLPGGGPVPVKWRKPMTHWEIFCPWCTIMVGRCRHASTLDIIINGSRHIKKHLRKDNPEAEACMRYEATGEFILPRRLNFREHWETYGMKVKGTPT
jgi:hypothetical protein